MAKINVVKAAADVVEATNETITAGLTVINSGAELGDAAIDALLAKVEESILNGTVETLAVAADVLNASEMIVTALNEKVNALQAETQEAYETVVAAQETLDKLELANPKAEELAAVEETLAAATARYNELVEALVGTEAALANAESYKEAAQAQYDALTKPAEADTPELPTPSVTPEMPEVEPETPVVPETPDEEEETTPATPVVTPSTTVTSAVEAVIIATTAATTETTTIAETNTEVTTETTVEETVVIEEEETPLANGEVVADEAIVIEDEETPLAADEAKNNSVVPAVAASVGGVSLLALLAFFLKRKKAI